MPPTHGAASNSSRIGRPPTPSSLCFAANLSEGATVLSHLPPSHLLNTLQHRVVRRLYADSLAPHDSKLQEKCNSNPPSHHRYGHTLLLRAADSSLYLFGGLDGRGNFLNDLWQFKLDPGQYECDWEELFAAQTLAGQYASRDTSATTPKRRGLVPGQPSGRSGGFVQPPIAIYAPQTAPLHCVLFETF